MINNISYNQNAGLILSIINANILALDFGSKGVISVSPIDATGMTYAQFITSLNTAYAGLETALYEDNDCNVLDDTSPGEIVDSINDNFDIVQNHATGFLAESPPFWVDVKILTIPTKGTAKIIAQTDNYKLASYGAEDILYMSDDCGLTWAYSKAFIGVAGIRMAYIFKNGSVLIGTNVNTLYSSQDFLTTLNEITVYEADGVTPMEFHTPVNPLYPGYYFGMMVAESGIINDTEILLWGNYWTQGEAVGINPRNMYYTIDGGITVKVAYKFGQVTSLTDVGTSGADHGGNPMGDVSNSVICKHVHSIYFNEYDSKFYIQTGDGFNKDNFMTAEYNSEDDSWTVVNHIMNETDYFFRAAGIRFYNGGNAVLWTSDGTNGGIIRTTIDKLFSTNLADHEYLLEGVIDNPDDANFIGLTKYQKTMLTTRYGYNPAIYGSIDYGITWNAVPVKYWAAVNGLNAVRLLSNTDSNGYVLLQSNPTGNLRPSTSYLLKIMEKSI